eukprot:TRINITY_DN5270_c0_g1_i2.p2 TRINITY_DN5270_c0_g1~~TRINITY_DN5270_c0_g1_i2.p2  ORF type:complete len:114 (+),score=22.72 TRINITY_DN5270_c0_g1_i2:86-427(+)
MPCAPTSAGAQRAGHADCSSSLAPVPTKPGDDAVIPALETDSDEEQLECPPPPRPTRRLPGLQLCNFSDDDTGDFLLPCVIPSGSHAGTAVPAAHSQGPSLLARLFACNVTEG